MAATGSQSQSQSAPVNSREKLLENDDSLINKKGGKMSSNFRLRKICQYCQNPFIAKTTVTQYCSDYCAKRNYKKRQQGKKITEAILDANRKLTKDSPEQKIEVTVPSSGIDRFNRDWLNMEDMS